MADTLRTALFFAIGLCGSLAFGQQTYQYQAPTGVLRFDNSTYLSDALECVTPLQSKALHQELHDLQIPLADYLDLRKKDCSGLSHKQAVAQLKAPNSLADVPHQCDILVYEKDKALGERLKRKGYNPLYVGMHAVRVMQKYYYVELPLIRSMSESFLNITASLQTMNYLFDGMGNLDIPSTSEYLSRSTLNLLLSSKYLLDMELNSLKMQLESSNLTDVERSETEDLIREVSAELAQVQRSIELESRELEELRIKRLDARLAQQLHNNTLIVTVKAKNEGYVLEFEGAQTDNGALKLTVEPTNYSNFVGSIPYCHQIFDLIDYPLDK